MVTNRHEFFRVSPLNLRTSLAVAIVVVSLSVLWVYSKATLHLLCEVDCGEAVLAIKAVEDFRSEGLRFGLLENLGTSEAPALYTHNVNIGGLLFVFLDLIGVTAYADKQLVVLAAFGLGLLYAFKFVQLASGSAIPAFVFLILMSTTYWGVTAFALNPLRAWHFVAMFGVGFHLLRCLNAAGLPFPRWHVLGLALTACVAFGCGYDFWVICGAFALMLTVFHWVRQSDFRFHVVCLALVAACFLVPFALRQGQVIATLGAEFWLRDVLFSIAIKVPGASAVLTLPSMAEVDQIYQSYKVFRPPAVPSNSIAQIFATMSAMIEFITTPRWGLASLSMLLIMLGYGSWLLCSRRVNGAGAVESPAGLVVNLLLPLAIAIALGLAMFAPFSLHVYLKHEFPLVAAPILLAKAIAIWWLIRGFLSAEKNWQKLAAVLGVSFLILDAAILHFRSSNSGLALNMRWMPFVSQHANARFLLSTYFERGLQRYLGIDDRNYTRTDPSDIRLMASASPDSPKKFSPKVAEAFLRADYWIYQPVDRFHFFDAGVPSCEWKDWLVSALSTPFSQRKLRLEKPWIDGARAAPDSVMFFGGTLPRSHGDVRLLVVPGGGSSSTRSSGQKSPAGAGTAQAGDAVMLNYNCIYRTVLGRIDLGNVPEGVAAFDLVAIRPSGQREVLKQFTIDIDSRAPKIDRGSSFPLPSSMSIDEAVRMFPRDAIIERGSDGIGYLIVRLQHTGS